MNCIVRLKFKATNNVVEYEALLVGLRLAKEMQVKGLLINSDSQLIISQVNGNIIARDKGMYAYLKLVIDRLSSFENFELAQILSVENAQTNALSKLASSKYFELLTIVPIEHLADPFYQWQRKRIGRRDLDLGATYCSQSQGPCPS